MSDELQESIESIQKACDKYFEVNENSTLHEIANSMEYYEKKRNNKRLNDIESRLDDIEKRLDKIEMILRG